MKFNNGYWMLREGVTQLAAKELYDYRMQGDTLLLYAPTANIQNRGSTLNQPMITIELSSPMEDVLRVRCYHFKGERLKTPSFAVQTRDVSVSFEETDTELRYTTGKTTAVVQKNGPWCLSFYYDGTFLTQSTQNSTACMIDHGVSYMKEELALSVAEQVYGLGERFTAYVKNGQSVDLYQEDGGTASEQAYKNIPFYLTTRGYGVFINQPERVMMEIASEKVNRVQFAVEGQSLEYFLLGANEPKEAIKRYTDLTGKPALPPAWSFGLWLSTSFVTSYDEETVMSFIDGMLERGIPLDVFHFDCCWMEEFEWCNFKWHPKMFPDPEGMIRRIHERGIRVCCWINSYIAQKSPLFDEAMEKGYLVKRPDGSVWQWDLWQAGMGLVDFTNPEATAWYQQKLEALLDMGVDCFKTDFGERIPTDVVWFDGSDPKRMHNYYTKLYNEAVYTLIQKKKGEQEAVLFARSATVGGQAFPVHWGGDCTSQYTSMAESLRGGLSFTMSGFGFWSHDIGGFEDGCEPDIYKRWTQFGLLSTHSRYHGSGEYKVPWLYGEEAVQVTRQFTQLKMDLMPYLYSCACETARTGVPMMRSMLLEFPKDETCWNLDRQYLLGDALLVAPVMSPDGEVSYYLPEGVWTNYFTGEQKPGGKWYREVCAYDRLPLYVREETILVTGSGQTHASYDYTDHVTVSLYGFTRDGVTRRAVYDASGKRVTEITVTVKDGVCSVDTGTLTNVSVVNV